VIDIGSIGKLNSNLTNNQGCHRLSDYCFKRKGQYEKDKEMELEATKSMVYSSLQTYLCRGTLPIRTIESLRREGVLSR